MNILFKFIGLGRKFLAICGFILLSSVTAEANVLVQQTPDGGLQPRLVTTADGAVHLLYFKKRLDRPAAREGNLYYREYQAEQGRFGQPVRVSSEAFNLQTVSISRASMAIDGEGRAHVMWYLPREFEYHYARSNPERTRFEPLRSMVTEYTDGLDAGGDVAAIGSQVALVWGAGDLTREHERSMYARFSDDGGATFGAETMIANPDLGACACCSMATDFVSGEELVVAYRSAIDGTGRHMQVLHLQGVGEGITEANYAPVHELQQWEASFCPLSTNDIGFSSASDPWLVFETESRIVQMNLSEPGQIERVAEPFTETRQKNPTIAFDKDGNYLIAWGEAISHSRGGRLNLRLFNAQGEVRDYQLEEEIQMQNFTFPAAAALPGGDFLVLY